MFTLLSVHGYSRLCERSSGIVRTGQGEYTDKVANALADFLVRLNATRERLGL